MKTLMRTLLNILKWTVILLILLFSIATWMGGSYLQTLLLILLALILAWWPETIRRRLSKKGLLAIRFGSVIVLLLVNVLFFRPDPKTSIYLSDKLEEELMQIYDEQCEEWPVGTEDIYISTPYGRVHVLACGSSENPPLVMVHAASMGAQSWKENLEPLLGHFRIYSIDNIGEGNKSKLEDALLFPDSEKAIADHLALIMDQLGVERSPLFGASNGGFIVQCFACYYPERAESLALFGPMGLTQITGKSIMMLSIATMYPFQSVRNRVTKWALGEDESVNQLYGKWFDCVMRSTIPSVAKPVPMTREQKSGMTMPVLLFLGNQDPIVGDAGVAEKVAREYPDIRVEILESGHLVAVEQREYVNRVVADFLLR